MNLKGRCAVVTGSTSGIGLGIAQKLQEAGCLVVLNGIEDPKVVESITCMENTIYVQADLSTQEGCHHLIDTAIQHFGNIDILVNNAGIQYVSPIQDFPFEKWNLILNLNLTAAFHTMARTLPHMRQKGWGRLINIASVHGLVASAQKSAYVAAKHGLVGLTKVVALETAKEPITCNAICPGWVLTPLVEKQIQDRSTANQTSFEEEKTKLLQEKQPSLAFVTPSDLGNYVLFLCSDAAAQITGVALPVDGAWTAQ